MNKYKLKIGDKVIFKEKPLFENELVIIGSNEGIGDIKDFDGEYIIIETTFGEAYINKKNVRLIEGDGVKE